MPQFTFKSLFGTISFAIVFVVLFGWMYMIRNVLLLFFISFILASALHPTVEKFYQKFNMPRYLSVALLNFGFISLILLVLLWVVPPLITQSFDLYATLSSYFQLPQIHFDRLSIQDVSRISEAMKEYEGLFQQFGQSWTNVLTMLSSAFTTVFVIVTGLIITSYMLLSFSDLSQSFSWLLPGKSRKEQNAQADRILENVRYELGSWIRGRGIVMIIIGTLTYIFLSLLGIPYALPLALLSGLLEIIPNIGPLLSAIPSVIIAFLFVNPWTAGMTIVLYGLIQQAENSFITPYVMKKTVDVHPLMTIFLIMIGYELMGVMGSLLSLPLYISFRALAKELWPNRGPFAGE